jgi:hypothetical protein
MTANMVGYRRHRGTVEIYELVFAAFLLPDNKLGALYMFRPYAKQIGDSKA